MSITQRSGYFLQPARRAEKGDLSRLSRRKGCLVCRRAQQRSYGEQQLFITGKTYILPDPTGIQKGTTSHTFIHKITSTVQQKLPKDGQFENCSKGLKPKSDLQRSDLDLIKSLELTSFSEFETTFTEVIKKMHWLLRNLNQNSYKHSFLFNLNLSDSFNKAFIIYNLHSYIFIQH